MNTNLNRAMSLCKGSFQRNLVNGYETIGSSTRKGKAKNYDMHYQQSAQHLMDRLADAGVPYHVELGPRGGIYSAKLVID